MKNHIPPFSRWRNRLREVKRPDQGLATETCDSSFHAADTATHGRISSLSLSRGV